ncbi:MAG: hypothetical protein JSU66_03900, partial [Deltaproteobacteria bacterium]
MGLSLAIAVAPPPARAFETEDGRLQVHGFGEVQLRAIARNFSSSDGYDLTQWYWVLNTEIEYDFLPDGWRFVDILQGFARVEVRYDCVWTRACGTFSSANVYGDRAKRLPARLGGARMDTFSGQSFLNDRRRAVSIPIAELESRYRLNPSRALGFKGSGLSVDADVFAGGIWNVPSITPLFGVKGIDGELGTDDDPALNVFERFLDYRFALRKVRGSEDLNGAQVLGPWHPKDRIVNIGSLRDRPNPFNPNDPNEPVLGAGGVGGLAQPFRPAPLFKANPDPGDPLPTVFDAQGIYYPSAGLRRELGSFDNTLQNFSQSDLAWNRGASQDDEKELKELYFDIEMFDARLWVRLGKQSIVWGKTELFRTTDQFNPQDLALASLPSLEESRISLWAARFVYSLYAVGPLDDVRLEFAFNYDDFEPSDLGRCGEPYTVNPACGITFGLFAHGLTGLALAGIDRPPDPWESSRGWEGGARLEFRWSRFSFALMDFYGFEDVPFQDRIFTYSRNVDPATGRPRQAGSREPCDPGGAGVSGCLGVIDPVTGDVDVVQTEAAASSGDPAVRA